MGTCCDFLQLLTLQQEEKTDLDAIISVNGTDRLQNQVSVLLQWLGVGLACLIQQSVAMHAQWSTWPEHLKPGLGAAKESPNKDP